MEENVQSVSNDIGTIKITDEVVAIIAGIAAMEVPGVTSMSGGIAGGIAEALGRKPVKGRKGGGRRERSRYRSVYNRRVWLQDT